MSTTIASARHSLRALGGRLGGQWERERRDTLLLMAAILLTLLPQLGHLSWWTTAGFAVLFGWRSALLMTGRPLPPDWARWATALACAASVFAQFGTLLGRDPGVSMLVLLLGLKLMELRARRDLFVVIFLCFFLLLTSFFHSQSMTAALLVLLAVLGLLGAMITMQFGARELALSARFRMAGTLLLQALPIAALLFVLFPRVQGPLWSMPYDANRGVTGLSDSMSPGQIASLAESDEVAFRVRFAVDPQSPSNLFWRGPVLGHFDGRTWRPATRRPGQPATPELVGDPATTLHYTVTLEPSGHPWLFALEAPVRVSDPPEGGAMLTPEMVLVARNRVSQRLRYGVDSQPGYRLGAGDTPSALRAWLQLPPGFNPRTLALAETWRAEQPDPAQRIERVLRHFGVAPFRYTLDPPLLGRHSVDEFLFETRAGFCEHYASAFVVVARAMGIPARVVTGYQGGERNPVDGFWIVRQADAHAWAEVWLEGRGWVRVDPTAAIAPERVESGIRGPRSNARDAAFEPSLFETLRFNLDAIGNAWNQWVLSYDSARQERLMADLGLDGADWRELTGMLAAGMALTMGALAVLTLAQRRSDDPVQRCYATFCARLARRGIVRQPHETANELLARAGPSLDAEAALRAKSIVALYNALRYGARDASRPERVRHLRALVQSFPP